MTVERTCETCHSSFTAIRRDHLCCSPTCRSALRRRRRALGWQRPIVQNHRPVLRVPRELTEDFYVQVRADFIDALCGVVLRHQSELPLTWTRELERAA